jgi:hypothetical protein
MPHAVFILSLVLWRIQQTIALLVLRLKPKNRHSDFEVQITKQLTFVLGPENQKTHPSGFDAKPLTNRPSSFEAKPLTNRQPLFWGSTKKSTLLVSICMVQTAHSVTRPPDHPITEYPTCA